MKELNELLDALHTLGHSDASIERSLDLPQRTLSRIRRTEHPSAATLALFRIIGTYPWVIDVAEEKFVSDEAQKIFIKAGVDAAFELKKNNLVCPACLGAKFINLDPCSTSLSKCALCNGTGYVPKGTQYGSNP